MITATNLVRAINSLSRNNTYNYINSKNHGLIKIMHIQLPEGPISIKRYNPSKGQTLESVSIETISTQLIWRVATAIQEKLPINIDRVLGASYNTRSVLESLLAYTPEFYYCYPGRIQILNTNKTIQHGHKHIMWLPSQPHELGILSKIETDIVISEIPSVNAIYESLTIPENLVESDIDIEVARRHAQIQIALLTIGQQLQFKTWIAQNDKGITYNNQKIGEMNGVIASLRDEKLMKSYEEAIKAAQFIDCIWFKNSHLMPAVMEIEHTTGVTSGLARMKNFKDCFPPFPTRYVIVAADDDRNKVVEEANKTMFKDLDIRFFSYSSVEELYSLCQRRKIKGVNEEFIDCFMEPVVA